MRIQQWSSRSRSPARAIARKAAWGGTLLAESPAPGAHVRKHHAYAATAKRRCGKFCFLIFIFSDSFVFCSRVNARRIARVFFWRRSNGVYFLPAYSLRASSRDFWVYTVNTRAMLFRTVPILASFEAAPPVTF